MTHAHVTVAKNIRNVVGLMTKHMCATDSGAIAEAAGILKKGGLVAFPTETVYGIGANALDKQAIGKIFKAKGRPSDNPLIVHIADMDMLSDIASDISGTAERLMEKFWPGPLTLIFRKTPKVPDAVSGGLATVAVRMPDNDMAIRLIKTAALPIAAPSANISGSPSPTSAVHVKADLDGKIDMILDGGTVPVGLESTILDMSADVPTILRPGAITLEMLEEVVGHVAVGYDLLIKNDEAPRAPGMKYKHYAPNAKLTIVKAKRPLRAAQFIRQKTQHTSSEYAVIVSEEHSMHYQSHGVKVHTLTPENLFDTLRKLDLEETRHAYVHAIEEEGVGTAVMNRLAKAANGNIIDLDQVLFVCTGNTCRSPMAQAIWQKYDTGCSAISRGVAAILGDRLSKNAEKALQQMGLEIPGFSSKLLSKDDIEQASIVLCMTDSHAAVVKQIVPGSGKVYTLAEFAESGGGSDVLDPYGGDLEIYQKCAGHLDKLISKIVERRKMTILL